MNIKNAEAHALAREIAERSGLSLTEAVLTALREKRAALGADRPPREAQAEVLLAYGRRLRRVRGAASSDTEPFVTAALGCRDDRRQLGGPSDLL